MFLSRHGILSPLLLWLMLPSSTLAKRAKANFDNESLRQAVNAWLEDPVAAMKMFGPIEDWSTWQVTDFSHLFQGAASFTADLNGWDTSSATTMSHMFAGCEAFDSELDEWDVRLVTDFSQAFYGASSFTGESLGFWDTSSALTMEQMFVGCSSFVGPENIGNWDTSHVVNMNAVFFQCTSFDRDINGWDMSSAQHTNSMFEDASSFSQSVCWSSMHSKAKWFQSFCGTNGAQFDLSESCPFSVHPSIRAYSQACDPGDILEELKEDPSFGRPEDTDLWGGSLDRTFEESGSGGLPILANPDEEDYDFSSRDRESEHQPDSTIIVPAVQREVSAASSSWRSLTGLLTPLQALSVAMLRLC